MEAKELTMAELRKLQLVQLELLTELDRVCRKHNIRYLLDGGTMIGAVRHKGFIPWDDDIDVAMLREDYEKLKNLRYEFNSSLCFFQDHSTDKNYRWGYGKLRKLGTSFVRVGQEHLKQQDGVFIDIFPFDDIPQSTFLQIIQDCYLFVLRKILWSEVGRKVSKKKLLRCWYFLLSLIPARAIFFLIDCISKRSSNTKSNRVRILMFPAFGTIIRKERLPLSNRYGLPKSVLLETAEFEFEGKKFLGYKDYHTRLTMEYDNYMTLPPIEDQVPHLMVSSYKF